MEKEKFRRNDRRAPRREETQQVEENEISWRAAMP